jgi:YNFM family putative membrane transporter
LTTGPIAEAYGWRWALAAVAVLALLCAGVAGALLPASRHFVARRSRALSSRAITDPALLALYGIGACAMGAFIAVFNALGFRLTSAPFALGAGAASAVFLVYPIGSLSSAVSGRLADRFGRRAVMPVGALLTAAGLLLTLSGRLAVVIFGLAVLTAGFFCLHGVASGWVPVRAHAGGVAAGQAASLYLVAYYAGASIAGSLAGTAWSLGGWDGVVLLSALLISAAGALAWRLRKVPAIA